MLSTHIAEGYLLQVGVLLDFVLRPGGVFHFTEGYLFMWALHKEAFSVNFIVGRFSLPSLLTLCCSVGLCPQTRWCIPLYRRLSSFYVGIT